MANPAVIGDITSRWRSLSAQETTNATTFLGDAYAMLVRRFFMVNETDLDELVDADENGFTAELIRVIATAVLRVMKNPDGKVREKIDDYEWQRDEAISAGLLYFTDEELDGLLPGAGAKGRAYSLDPFAGRDWDDLP